jgi:hypothetical protein
MEAGIPLETSEKKGFGNPLAIILILLVVFETIRVVYISRKKSLTIGQALKNDAKLLATPTAIVAVLGFVTGVMEFVIASNVKQYGFPDSIKGLKLFTLPPKKDLIQTATIILIVSTITGVLTDLTLKRVIEGNDKSARFMN